eukprot:344250-Prorocentrum_minimum.AAC.1
MRIFSVCAPVPVWPVRLQPGFELVVELGLDERLYACARARVEWDKEKVSGIRVNGGDPRLVAKKEPVEQYLRQAK